MGQKVLLLGRKSRNATGNHFSLVIDESFQLALVTIIKKHCLIFRHLFLDARALLIDLLPCPLPGFCLIGFIANLA